MNKLDEVYAERNMVVAALSKVFPAWLGYVSDAEPGWSTAVYIDLPGGQVSWHVSDREISELFSHLRYDETKEWDEHTTQEKYDRLNSLKGPPNEGS